MTGAGPGEPTGARPAGIGVDNWLTPPYAHYSLQHVAQLVPTAPISRGTGAVAELPRAPAPLAGLAVRLASGLQTTVDAVLAATATDAWAVLRDGRLEAEQYFDGAAAHTPHLLFSVSKSLIGAVAGVLCGAGVLDPGAPVSDYVPALANSGYAGATVRHVLDMRSGIAFSEDHRDPDAELHRLDEAMGWAPRRPDSPATLYGFLPTLRAKSAHGGTFEYRSCETDVLGWVCEAAAGAAMPQLLSQLLWSRIGAAADANIGVDAAGTGLFDGGISACLLDLLRFGALFLRDGAALSGEQVLPAAWIADTLAGDPDSRAAFTAPDMPGGMYRNQLWFPRPGADVLLAVGMCGQLLYIDRPAGVVAAKLSTQPAAVAPQVFAETLAAFDVVARVSG